MLELIKKALINITREGFERRKANILGLDSNYYDADDKRERIEACRRIAIREYTKIKNAKTGADLAAVLTYTHQADLDCDFETVDPDDLAAFLDALLRHGR